MVNTIVGPPKPKGAVGAIYFYKFPYISLFYVFWNFQTGRAFELLPFDSCHDSS